MHMKFLSFIGALALGLTGFAGELQNRFFFAGYGLGNREKTEEFIKVVQMAGKCGFNGMVLQGNIQNAWDLRPNEKKNLLDLKAACDKAGVDLIPAIWSIGYGTMYSVNPNLAEGLPTFDVPYTVSGDGTKATFDAPPSTFENGGFEDFIMNANGKSFKLPGWKYVDQSGVQCFIDEKVKHSGKRSIRYELQYTDKHAHARACRSIKVKPNTRYYVSAWIKTEDLDTTSGFQFTIYTAPKPGEVEGFSQQLTFSRPHISNTSDWTQWGAEISTLDHTELYVYLGSWSARKGRFWLDDVELVETGFPDMLRRPGCPFMVRNAQTGVTYVAGKDYVDIPPMKAGQEQLPRVNKSLVLGILPGGAIKPGMKLSLSGYRYHRMKAGEQVTMCMSEPQMYQLFDKSAKALEELIHPKKWFLPMDEVRAGGTCAACKARHTDMAHIFGDCVTRQFNIIRKYSPNAPVFIWADLMDPNMNGRDGICLCKGTFADSHKYVPKDIIAVHWGDQVKPSMDFFTANQFGLLRSRDIGGSFNDAWKTRIRNDFKAALSYPGCHGYMYTTWSGEYTQQKFNFFAELFRSAGVK